MRLLAPTTMVSSFSLEERSLKEEGLTKLCLYDIGQRQVVEDAPYWNEYEEGLPSDQESNPDCQEGFNWDCCSRRGDEEGCMRTFHQPPRGKRRRS